jgi:hypothetical protein
MSNKSYGPATSGYRDPEGRSFETVVYQASKPVLDVELNLAQDTGQDMNLRLQRRTYPSGWLAEEWTNDYTSYVWASPVSPVANLLTLYPFQAIVNGWHLNILNTNSNAGLNVIDLGACPVGVGSKRTDFVILEVWRRLLPAAPTTTGKSPAGRIWQNGNVKIAAADDLTLNYSDDILDGAVGSETTKRVQIQYRLRVINGIDLFTYPFGLNDPLVVANTVPAAAAAPDGVATVFTYTNQYASSDSGLWRAGDGNPANALGTVDGYIYALPLCAVFRRNSTAFDRNTNSNGGAVYPGPSDRPDQLFSDIIASVDVYDMRNGISPSGWDYTELLQKSVGLLLENSARTEIGSTLLGGGVEGSTLLWADEIGVSNANGGDGVTTGDTPGAEFIGEFDAVRRVFSDRAVYETIVLNFSPSDQSGPPSATWVVGRTITISPSALGVWPYTPFNWTAYAPSDVTILDITRAAFVGSSPGQIAFNASSNFLIQGLGAIPQGALTLTIGSVTDGINTATTEDLYITILVAYPSGVGLSKTPVATLGTSGSFVNGVLINNPAQLPAISPILFSSLVNPTLSYANREVRLEYLTVSQSFSYRPGAGAGNNILYLPERPDPSITPSITINSAPYAGGIVVTDYRLTLDPGSVAASDDVFITYQSIRALPQNDEQLTVYYQTVPAQTIREALLPTNISLDAKSVSQNMFVITAGSGTDGQAYPYPYQYVQAGAVYPSSSGTYAGDHELDGDLRTSIQSLYTDTGFMQVPVHVPLAPAPSSVSFGRSPGDVDVEGRTYYKTAPSYKMLAVGPTLSDPKKHKNLLPVLCEVPSNYSFAYRGELVLVILSRWASFDDSNSVGFLSDLTQNTTSASVYRLKSNLLSNRRT